MSKEEYIAWWVSFAFRVLRSLPEFNGLVACFNYIAACSSMRIIINIKYFGSVLFIFMSDTQVLNSEFMCYWFIYQNVSFSSNCFCSQYRVDKLIKKKKKKPINSSDVKFWSESLKLFHNVHDSCNQQSERHKSLPPHQHFQFHHPCSPLLHHVMWMECYFSSTSWQPINQPVSALRFSKLIAYPLFWLWGVMKKHYFAP